MDNSQTELRKLLNEVDCDYFIGEYYMEGGEIGEGSIKRKIEGRKEKALFIYKKRTLLSFLDNFLSRRRIVADARCCPTEFDTITFWPLSFRCNRQLRRRFMKLLGNPKSMKLLADVLCVAKVHLYDPTKTALPITPISELSI